MEPSPGLPSHEASQYLPGLRRLFDEQQQADAATSSGLRAAEPAGSSDSPPALLSSSASDVGTFGRSSSSILLPTSSALNVRIEAPVEPSSIQLARPPGDAALPLATARQLEKQRMADDDEVEDMLSVSVHDAPAVEPVAQERLDPREHWAAGAAGSPPRPMRTGSAQQQQRGSSSQPASSDRRSRDGSPERRGFGVGERGGASGQEFSPLRRVLTPAQEESQARAQEKRRQSEELDREFVRMRGSSSSIISPPLSPTVLAAASGASERSPYQRHGLLGDNNRSLRAASYPDATPAMLAAAAASTSARRISASRRPASRPLSVDHTAAPGKRGRTSSAPISPAGETPRLLVSSADREAGGREAPSRGADSTRRALSFTPGTLPDGTLAGTEVPRRTSSQRAHDRSAGHSPTDRRRHHSGSHLGASPGTLASRWSSGDWYGVAAADEWPGSSRLSGEHGRHSFSTLLASQARAHSRFHMTAWAALRPRFPAQLHTLRPLRFTSIWPRLHHATLLLSTYAQVPATLFLDYNVLFVLASLARFPSVPGTEAGWWTAVAVYGACVLVWLFGVLMLWDVLISYGRRWRKSQPEILPIYLRSAAFSLSTIKSYSVYSLLYRVRMRATRRDFFIETCWFQSQNWPTVLTLVPRGIICTVVLSIYRERSEFGPVLGRDPIYFAQDSDALTAYAFVVLLIFAAWAAFRTLLLLLSYLGLLFAVGPRSLIDSVDKPAPGSEEEEAIRLSDYHSNGSRRPLVGESPAPMWASEVGMPQAAARTSGEAFSREHAEELGAAATLPAAWRDRAEDRIRDALLEFGPGAPSTQDHSPRGSLERRTDMAEKRRSYLSASGTSGAGHGPVTLASTPMASPQMVRAGSAGAWEHIEGDAASPPTRGRPLPSEDRASKLASAQSSRAPSAAPSVALLPPSRASTFGVVTHEPLEATPVPSDSQAGGSGRFASFGSATPSFKRAALVAGGGAVSTLAVTDESPQQEPRGEKRPRGSEDSMEYVITPSASFGDAARLSHISSSSGTSSAGEQVLVLPFPSASTSDVTATPQRDSRERLSDSPPHSGDERRGDSRRSSKMERRGTLSPRSIAGDSPPSLQPSSDSRLGRPSRANSSLSSLTESIRGALSRVAMRSGESLSGDGGEGVHTPRISPPIATAALASGQEASESAGESMRASSSWWPALVGRRNKSSPPTEAASLEPAPAPPAIEIERPSSPREGGSLLALSKDQAALSEADDQAPAGERASDEPVPPSPALSLRTIETAASDDSEERRLWATFPDQSRRHPPGLIALEHEQRQLEAAAARQREQREQLGEMSERTPRVAAVSDAAAAAAMASDDAYSSGSSHAIPILGARSTSPDDIAGTQHLSASPTAQELAVSPSQGGLIPIKEESWGSSLDASSGAPSPTRSHASDAPTGAPH